MFRRFMRLGYWGPLLDGDGGGGAGGGTGGGAGGGTGDGGGAGGGGENQPFATFQDEASFMARIKREGKAQLEATAKALGFESADAMQAAAKAKKDADAANQTELEKEKAAREKAEADSKAVLETANKRLVDAEIKVLAKDAGFADVTDAVALIDRTSIQVDDQGNVTGAKEAVEALAKAKPHLLGEGKPDSTPGSTGNVNRQAGGGDKKTEFASNLAKKRAEEAKQTAENPYFK